MHRNLIITKVNAIFYECQYLLVCMNVGGKFRGRCARIPGAEQRWLRRCVIQNALMNPRSFFRVDIRPWTGPRIIDLDLPKNNSINCQLMVVGTMSTCCTGIFQLILRSARCDI